MAGSYATDSAICEDMDFDDDLSSNGNSLSEHSINVQQSDFDEYLNGSKKICVYIANGNHELIFKIETTVLNVQSDIAKRFNLLSENSPLNQDNSSSISLHRFCENPNPNDKLVKLVFECPETLLKINISDHEGKTPLHVAVIKSKSPKLVEILLCKPKIDVNIQDHANKTPLHYSVHDENLLWILLNNNEVDTTLKDNDGKTILHYYCSSLLPCRKEIVEKIISKGGSKDIISIKDNQLKSPFNYAHALEKYEILGLLHTDCNGEKIDWKSKDVEMRTKLFDAIADVNENQLDEVLDEKNMNLGNLNVNKDTALHYAISFFFHQSTNVSLDERGKRLKILKKLINCNEVILKEDLEGKTPFHHACHKADPGIVNLFVSKCFDINLKCDKGKTPLHYAMENGNWKVFLELLKKDDIDITIKDKDGRNVLHCFQKEDIGKLKPILKHESFTIDLLTNKDNSGRTPYKVARDNNFILILFMMVKKIVGKELTIADLKESDVNVLSNKLDGWCYGTPNWEKLCRVLNVSDKDIFRISKNCLWIVGKNVIRNIKSLEITVNKMLEVSVTLRRGDIKSLLEEHQGKKVKELNTIILEDLAILIGTIAPGIAEWKQICEHLNFTENSIMGIENHNSHNNLELPTRELFRMLKTQDPDFSLMKLHRCLTNVNIKHAANSLLDIVSKMADKNVANSN